MKHHIWQKASPFYSLRQKYNIATFRDLTYLKNRVKWQG